VIKIRDGEAHGSLFDLTGRAGAGIERFPVVGDLVVVGMAHVYEQHAILLDEFIERFSRSAKLARIAVEKKDGALFLFRCFSQQMIGPSQLLFGDIETPYIGG
jgi:hypothetical protein